MLFRENEHTLVEGPARGHARHGRSAHAHWRHVRSRITCLHPKSGSVRAKANEQEGPSASLAWSLRKACAAKLVEGRGDALFDLAARAWYWNETSESSEVRLRMTYSHTIRHGQHTIRKRLQLWNGSGALIQWIHWALQVVVHWSWSRCLPWCNGLQRDAAHEARERFVLSTSLRGLSRVLIWTTFS